MNTTETEINPLFSESNRATYCPEDNKLRLYVGRVPRAEYEALRADGWTSTPKQDCDFVATWTPSRRDTCERYAGIIEDEDAGPDERAADRAERFLGYLDKRSAEAHTRADSYESGPAAHGYQNERKAERAAARHNRLGARAVDAWSKAEYWQQRTAGVIRHALHVSSPSVRMGRIKTIEADLRRTTPGSEWHTHLTLRLAYENQMLEAQGGRLANVEIEPAGYIGGKLIVKVNKSSVTGRVVSVELKGPRAEGWAYRTTNVPGADYSLYKFDTERMPISAYTPPTDESRAELAALKQETKAKAPKKDPCPLINPTEEDAERLQAIWNERRTSRSSSPEPRQVIRMTQAQYSANSGGTYSRCETTEITGGGFQRDTGGICSRPDCPAVAKVREFSGRVIIITDKPQKPFPAAVWNDPRPAIKAEILKQWPLLEAACRHNWFNEMTPEESAIFERARLVRWAYVDSLSQFGLSQTGRDAAPKQAPAVPVATAAHVSAEQLALF